jgi:hypothetical protein
MSNSAGSMPRAVTFLSDAIVLQQVHIGNTCSGDMIACY